MCRKPYPTDLNDVQWLILEPLLMAVLNQSKRGRPRQVDLREIVNAIFYVLRTGCAWRLLPHDFPAWQTVYGYFRRWRESGRWEQLCVKQFATKRNEKQNRAQLLLIVKVSKPVLWPVNAALIRPNW